MGKKKILNSTYSERRLFILDEETRFLIQEKESNDIISSEEEFNTLELKSKNYIQIVIQAELNWHGHFEQDFFGFSIARELRMRHKLLCPIILMSSLPQKHFERLSKNNITYNILFGRGTGFVEINNISDKLENIPLLKDASLTDLNEMLLNLRGFIIDRLTHDMKYGLSKNKLNEVLNTVGAYLDSKQKAAIKWDDNLQNICACNDSVEFEKTKNEFLLKCNQEFGRKISIADLPNEVRHKLIVVEDDPEFKEVIQKNISKYFDISITDSASIAINWLDEDKQNNIVGILSDWRLYIDNSKTYWQQQQGYEVLEYAAKTHFISLFSLTSLDDRNVHNIRNMLGLDIYLIKKQFLINDSKDDNQWKLLADIVLQKCNSIIDIISSQPTGARWTLDYFDKSKTERIFIKPLKAKYREQRSFNWSLFENEIATKSDEIWAYYKAGIDTDGEIDSKMISGIKDKHGLELGAKDPELESILIARRIFFALWFNSEKIYQSITIKKNTKKDHWQPETIENPLINVYCAFNGTSWEAFKESYESPKSKQKYSTDMTKKEQAFDVLIENSKKLANLLCIEATQLPAKGILPEERGWLLKQGLDISKGNSTNDYTTLEEDLTVENEDDEPTETDIGEIESDYLANGDNIK